MAGRQTLIREAVIVAVFAGFVAYEVSNEWTHLGTHRVMFSDGRAWFVGIGS